VNAKKKSKSNGGDVTLGWADNYSGSETMICKQSKLLPIVVTDSTKCSNVSGRGSDDCDPTDIAGNDDQRLCADNVGSTETKGVKLHGEPAISRDVTKSSSNTELKKITNNVVLLDATSDFAKDLCLPDVKALKQFKIGKKPAVPKHYTKVVPQLTDAVARDNTILSDNIRTLTIEKAKDVETIPVNEHQERCRSAANRKADSKGLSPKRKVEHLKSREHSLTERTSKKEFEDHLTFNHTTYSKTLSSNRKLENISNPVDQKFESALNASNRKPNITNESDNSSRDEPLSKLSKDISDITSAVVRKPENVPVSTENDSQNILRKMTCKHPDVKSVHIEKKRKPIDVLVRVPVIEKMYNEYQIKNAVSLEPVREGTSLKVDPVREAMSAKCKVVPVREAMSVKCTDKFEWDKAPEKVDAIRPSTR